MIFWFLVVFVGARDGNANRVVGVPCVRSRRFFLVEEWRSGLSGIHWGILGRSAYQWELGGWMNLESRIWISGSAVLVCLDGCLDNL